MSDIPFFDSGSGHDFFDQLSQSSVTNAPQNNQTPFADQSQQNIPFSNDSADTFDIGVNNNVTNPQPIAPSHNSQNNSPSIPRQGILIIEDF